MTTEMQAARLIPTTGIGSDTEAEQRATSALLAVVSIVRPFSKALLDAFGAPRAQKAEVETFVEVTFKLPNGKKVRPDGLIRVSYGKAVFTALVEVKTGNAALSADQLNSYWEIARTEGFDCVLSISNEIPPSPGVHPTEDLKVRSNSKTAVHHISWTEILTKSIMHKVHRGVEDPEQAWILGELIRYLEHPNSGVVSFDDMGTHWVDVREGAKNGTLNLRDAGVQDIAMKWDQLLGFAALKLGAEIGDDVTELVPRKHQLDPKLRTKDFCQSLVQGGCLDAKFRIPNAASDLNLVVDLKARQSVVSTTLKAPNNKGAKGRIGWLVRQLAEAPEDLVVEAYPKNSRLPIVSTLEIIREDPTSILGEDKKEPVKFVLLLRRDLAMNRRNGTRPGFAESTQAALKDFYGQVLQNLSEYRPSAPRLKTQAPSVKAQLEDQSSFGQPTPDDRNVVNATAPIGAQPSVGAGEPGASAINQESDISSSPNLAAR